MWGVSSKFRRLASVPWGGLLWLWPSRGLWGIVISRLGAVLSALAVGFAGILDLVPGSWPSELMTLQVDKPLLIATPSVLSSAGSDHGCSSPCLASDTISGGRHQLMLGAAIPGNQPHSLLLCQFTCSAHCSFKPSRSTDKARRRSGMSGFP